MRHVNKRRYFLLLLMCAITSVAAFAQNVSIKGKVVDKNGAPVAGAAVHVKGKQGGAGADEGGRFAVQAAPGDVLIVTAVNFKDTEVKVRSEVTPLLVTLDDAVSLMEEVIVTAGGIKTKRKEVGTATTVIKGDVLTTGKSTTIAGGLQGKVAGLQISGTGGGVNPSYRLVLRGQRSLTGNNQALVVLDNVIVPTSVLGNLNPEDVENVTVLNGAGAAALYGSQASNGAMIVTTRKGRNGFTNVRVSNTVTAEQVAFFPKLQSQFGSGGSAYGYDENGDGIFAGIENQSYGPRYDGSTKALGDPLEDGSQLYAVYASNNSRKEFWNTGVTNQTDFSVTSGDAVSTFYVSGQYATATGTTPGDKYNRANIRVNGTRKIGNRINVTYSTAYTQNRYDITTQTSSMYNNLLNMPSWIPITRFKNWRTDKFANPNGFYNPWYQNPYFTIDNNRSKQRNDYLIANVEVKFTPFDGLDLVARQGIATRNYSNKNTTGAFDYTTYAEDQSGGSKSDIAASVSDGSSYTSELLSDAFAQYHKKLSTDFDLNAIGGMQWRQDQAKQVNVSASGLVIPDYYNVNAGVGTPGASEANFLARQMGAYGDIRLGYKGYLFLHATGRNDWVSILEASNRSFFYPAVDLSFVASDAIDAVRTSKTISYLKLRAGWSKVGQVNLGNSGDFGAYYLLPTYSQANGYPYGNQAGYTVGNSLVASGLRPEITKGYEVGFDLNLWKDRVVSTITYYSTNTTDQTVNTYISNTTGYSRLLLNSGKTSSSGLEATVHVTPVKTRDLDVTVGGNYTYLKNNVNSINASLPNLPLAYYSDNAGSYAVEGKAFPVIMGYDYQRDPEGHVIIDRTTGNPMKDDNIKILGNATPKHRLGLDATVTWKQFRFSLLFEYRGGYKVFNAIGSTLDWSGTGIRTVAYNRKRFVFPNSVYEDPNKPGTYIKNTNIQVPDGNGNSGFWTDDDLNMGITSNYVTSGAFWKLREASITYNVPAKLLAGTKFIKGASISVQGRNLFLWLAKDNLYTDPEYSDAGSDSNGIGLNGLGQTPPSRYFGGTVSFNF